MPCKSLAKVKHGDLKKTEELTVYVGTGARSRTYKVHKGLLQKVTQFHDAALTSEAGQNGKIFLKKDDPDTFDMFHRWLYCDYIMEPPTQFTVDPANLPSADALKELEADLHARFNRQQEKLCDLYCLAEKWDIEDLMNRAIDLIQDGFHKYGTVFGPGFLLRIFKDTKKGSPLRDLCVGTNVIHIDRGCDQLRQELMMVSLMNSQFFPAMLKWISRNFVMFGRRQREGFDIQKPDEGFSILNRSKLCPCHFHKHTTGRAHKGHEKCATPFMKCGHSDDDEIDNIDSILGGIIALGVGN